MLRVALTGGVGSGKSAVAAMLLELGAAVSQSDEVGRSLMQPGQPVFQAVAEHFGSAVLTPSGALDRAALAHLAFHGGRLEELNALVHPAVIAAQAQWMDGVGVANPLAIAVVESALVFETRHGSAAASGPQSEEAAKPWRERFDRIVVITAPEDVRLQRYVARVTAGGRGATDLAAADFRRRAAAQWSDAEKAALADFMIDNGGSLEALQEQVQRLFVELRREAESKAAAR